MSGISVGSVGWLCYKDFAPTGLVALRLSEGGACDETGPRLISKSGPI